MSKISHRKHKFEIPEPLSQKDYNLFKKALSEDSNFKISPTSPNFSELKSGLEFISYGGVVIILMTTLSLIAGFDGLIGLVIIFLFIEFVVIINYYFSKEDISTFRSMKKSYYLKLKKDIIQSKDYIDFTNIRKEI